MNIFAAQLVHVSCYKLSFASQELLHFKIEFIIIICIITVFIRDFFKKKKLICQCTPYNWQNKPFLLLFHMKLKFCHFLDKKWPQNIDDSLWWWKWCFSQCLSMQEIKFALKKTYHNHNLFFAALKSKLSTSICIKMNSMNSPRCSSTRYSIWCLCTVLAESQPVMLAKHFMALTRIRSDENLKSHWTGCAGMCV